MPVFPEYERVIYQKNTLDQVVCQLRFPTILRIDASPPADFQDAVRESYPLFVAKSSPELPPNLPPEIARMLAADLSSSGSAYEFLTEDESWKLSLTKEFVALTTNNYVRWEDFRAHLEAPLKSLEKIYSPSFYVRIGLRYKNVIDCDALGIKCDWKDLITPHVLGELSTEGIGDRIETAARDIVIRLENGGKVRVQHGLSLNKETKKNVYVIDADYHTAQRTEVDHAIGTLDRLNAESGHLFRWCITERLHDTMDPQPV